MISHRSKTALVSTGVFALASQWDRNNQQVVNNPQSRELNYKLRRLFSNAEMVLMDAQQNGELGRLSCVDIRSRIMEVIDPSFAERKERENRFVAMFEQFAERHENDGTRNLYLFTLDRVRAYCKRADELGFEDITHQWLKDFDKWMSKTMCVNSRSIHMRNIRAVFNDAIEDGITDNYPFRKFKIKHEATRKRALSLEQLRTLFSLDLAGWQEEFRDMFKLIFLLVGINAVDLCRMTGLHGGRIEYRRAKTGKMYDIKVEPEAMELIEKYRGDKHLLNILERWGNHKDWLHRLNTNLKWIGGVSYERRKTKDGKFREVAVREDRWPGLTTYWARHSWATIAASIDIPEETIAHALGHVDDAISLFGLERNCDILYAFLAYKELQKINPRECSKYATTYLRWYENGIIKAE